MKKLLASQLKYFQKEGKPTLTFNIPQMMKTMILLILSWSEME